jgi:hypothetical protein
MLLHADSAVAHHTFAGLVESLRGLEWSVLSGSPAFGAGRVGGSVRAASGALAVGSASPEYGTLHGAERFAVAVWMQDAWEVGASAFVGFLGPGAAPANGVRLLAESSDSGSTYPLWAELVAAGVAYRFPAALPDMDPYRGPGPGVPHILVLQLDRRGPRWSLASSLDGGPFAAQGVSAPRLRGPDVDLPLQTADDESHFGLALSGHATVDEIAFWRAGDGLRRFHAVGLMDLWVRFRSPMSAWTDRFGEDRHAPPPKSRGRAGAPCRVNARPTVTAPSGLHMDVEAGSQPRENEMEFLANDPDGGAVSWFIASPASFGVVSLHAHPRSADAVVARYDPGACGTEDAFVLRAESRCGLGEDVAVTVSIAHGAMCPIVPDSVSLADAAARGVAAGKADSVSLTDAIAMGTSKADSVPLADAFAFAAGIPEADSVSLADAVVIDVGVNASDALFLADGVAASEQTTTVPPPTTTAPPSTTTTTPAPPTTTAPLATTTTQPAITTAPPGPAFGAESEFLPANGAGDISAASLGSGKFVVAYRDAADFDHGTARVGTVSGTAVTFGPEAEFQSAAAGASFISVVELVGDKFVVAYADAADSYHGTARVGTVSGTDITFGPEAEFLSAGAAYHVSAAALDPTHFVVAYRDNADGDHGTARVGTVSGADITFGAETEFLSAGAATQISAAALSATAFVVAYQDNADAGHGTARVGTVSGTDVTFGAEAEFLSAGGAVSVSAAALSGTQFVVAYYDAADSGHGTARVGTVSGTDVTFGAEAEFLSASGALFNSVAAIYADKFVVAYADYSDSGHGTARVGTVSGTAIAFGTEAEFLSAGVAASVSAAAIGPGEFVVAYADAADSYHGTAKVGSV